MSEPMSDECGHHCGTKDMVTRHCRCIMCHDNTTPGKLEHYSTCRYCMQDITKTSRSPWATVSGSIDCTVGFATRPHLPKLR